jgi:BirA family biotin operon repressor/biotin-[acetyl-CoA-carboxylase] ligase
MDRLDAAQIALPGVEVRVVERCTSTNDLALKASSSILIAAEEQTAGRGRRGRRWHSARGAGITFSLGRRIDRPVRELAALSLVAGVAAARALRALGAEVELKWPNDLMLGGGKLGGILVETRNGNYAVIGIGINYRRAPLRAKVRQPMAFLDIDVPRSEVIRRVAIALLEAIAEFERQGLDALRGEWQAMDAHAGQRLRVRMADGRVMSGRANGLAQDGSLQLMTRKGLQSVRSGRLVSARAA